MGRGLSRRGHLTEAQGGLGKFCLPRWPLIPSAWPASSGKPKSVAALNHPNIVTIHSVEEVDGTHFLTMEWVDGQYSG